MLFIFDNTVSVALKVIPKLWIGFFRLMQVFLNKYINKCSNYFEEILSGE